MQTDAWREKNWQYRQPQTLSPDGTKTGVGSEEPQSSEPSGNGDHRDRVTEVSDTNDSVSAGNHKESDHRQRDDQSRSNRSQSSQIPLDYHKDNA
jgi:hypothetical protein